jgi:uncharacterized membrane protein HdeD (DUF308 family)
MPTTLSPADPTDNPAPPSSGSRERLSVAELRHRWGWFVALGVALLLLGTMAFLNMLVATVASVYTVGILMLIGAAIQIGQAFSVKSWSSFAWWILGGVIYALAGLATLVNPLLASAFLTLFLAAALVASGVSRIWVGFQSRPSANWGWLALSGLVTLLAGLVIAMGWPVNSLWVLGMFLAIDLLFQGWASIALGLALRRGRTSP